jgi:hypothetical protein
MSRPVEKWTCSPNKFFGLRHRLLPTVDGRRGGGVIPVILALVFGLSFLIRFYNIGHAGLWLDEVLQVKVTTGPFACIWKGAPKNKPPLDYYIQWLFLHGGEAEEWRVRLHACVLGAGAVAAMGLCGYAMGGLTLAFVALALTFANPLMIRFSQDGRPYSLMLFSECLFLAVFWRFLSGDRSPKPSGIIAIALSAILCLWSLYWSAMVCLASLLFGLVWLLMGSRRRFIALATERRKGQVGAIISNRRLWLVSAVCLVLVLLSGVPLVFRAARAMEPQFYGTYDVVSWEKGRMYMDIFAMGYEWTQYVKGAGWVMAALALVGGVGWIVRRGRASAAFLCLYLFLIFFPGMFLFYRMIDHWMEVRYVLAGLPPLLMLCAMGIETMGNLISGMLGKVVHRLSRIRAIVIILLTLIIVSFSLRFILANPLRWADWRGFTQRLKEESVPPRVVVIGNFCEWVVLEHYLNRYRIQQEVVLSDFKPAVLRDILFKGGDVMVAFEPHRASAPFNRAVASLPAVEHAMPWITYISLGGLDVRRRYSPQEMERVRPVLMEDALGGERMRLTIRPGEEPSPFLGAGWSTQEQWVEIDIRALDGPWGEFYLPVSEPLPLTLTLRVYPYAPEAEPPLGLKIMVNHVDLGSKPVGAGWNILKWDVDAAILQKGVNDIYIIPSRILSPSSRDPKSGDFRELSVWVERVEVEARR